ncbi:MAG: porin [Myxococcota bacterium]
MRIVIGLLLSASLLFADLASAQTPRTGETSSPGGARLDGLPPPPMAPPPIFPSQLEDEEEVPRVGFSQGRFFLRDDDDVVRLYPGGRARTDVLWSPRAPDLDRNEGEGTLGPSFVVRRLRLELSGELFERIAFTLGAELGGQRIGETTYVGPDTPRVAPAQAHDGRIVPADVTLSYRFRPWLSVTVGQQNLPFSMSNRTREFATTFMERNLAIRGFAVPSPKDLGVVLWGDVLPEALLSYEAGVFNGDGSQRPFADDRADVVGRVFARPLAPLGEGLFWDELQIGMSARFGPRQQEDVDYDLPTIATNHGFVLWQPGYVDAVGRVTRVLPSGAENAIGGEVRVPVRFSDDSVLEVRGEAVRVVRRTREAIAGLEATNTERFGQLTGTSWYAEVSFWGCCGDQLVNGRPGTWRPYTVDPRGEAALARGPQVSLLAGGIHARYRGGARGDAGVAAPAGDGRLTVVQVGAGAQYWFGTNLRAAVNYFAYVAPGAGSASRNLIVVPDNLPATSRASGDGEVHHELGFRTAVTF